MCVCVCDFLEWLTGCASCHPTTHVSCWKGQGSSSFSVHKTGYPWSPKEVLESCQFSVHVGMWLGIDKLARESGASRQKARTPFFRVFAWAASRRCGPNLTWGLLTSKDPDFSCSSHFKQPTKKSLSQVCPAAWVFVTFKCCQVDSPDQSPRIS